MTDQSDRDRSPEASSEAGSDLAEPLHRGIEAVLFDMDGVVTDTAAAHAAAWKRMFDEFLERWADSHDEETRPFDVDRDYRVYVDGKPRYDGVRSFLESRGIEIDEGDQRDGPDHETVCGLGNRKNDYFLAWIDENQVRAFPGTLRLIQSLRDASIKTAVFSSSRNTKAVLRSAGAFELFDAKVDGNDLVERGLPGKPDPAMLLEAAERLGTPPERAAVIEDAIAGVEAGARGHFGLVIGIDRAGTGGALRDAGAHLTIRDASELALDDEVGLAVKTLATVPSAWERIDAIRERLSSREPVVFLDYDGTLTPIIEDPTKTHLSNEMRQALARLGKHCTVAIVSGRDVDMLRGHIGLDGLYFAGSHGFEIEGPAGWSERLEKGMEFLPELDAVEEALRKRLSEYGEGTIERKRFAIAVHYRRVDEEAAARIEEAVDSVIAEHPGLKKGQGKKVFRIQPRIDWNKGSAVLWLLERLGLQHAGVLPLYIGDDITDEDAFQVLAGRGVPIAVRGEEERPTAADLTLADTADVARFLDFLAAAAANERPRAAETSGDRADG